MAKEDFVQAVKQIVARFRSGALDEGYLGYCALFKDDAFPTNSAQDQRQALRLMILLKGAPSKPTEAMIEAHQAAIPVLTELVNNYGEPADYELLGVCYVLLGDPQSADRAFRAGLAIERGRNPQSDLCGSFMKRISFL